jgi:hypothetical protein
MKKLNQFQRFDWNAFSDGKLFLVTGTSEWQDYDTKEHLGTVVEVVIYKDDTKYVQKEGEHVTNRFEKLKFKVRKDVDVPLNRLVQPVGVTATIYGDYRNQLSVKADDIKVIQTSKQG